MKIKHSKYRNTGLIYELLVKQIAADVLENKESKAIKILKKYYSGNSTLAKEYKLSEFVVKNNAVNQYKAETIISHITEVSRKLHQKKLKKEQQKMQQQRIETPLLMVKQKKQLYQKMVLLIDNLKLKNFLLLHLKEKICPSLGASLGSIETPKNGKMLIVFLKLNLNKNQLYLSRQLRQNIKVMAVALSQIILQAQIEIFPEP